MSKITVWDAIRKGAQEFPVGQGNYILFDKDKMPIAVCGVGAMFAATTERPKEEWWDLNGLEIMDTVEKNVIGADKWLRGRIVEQTDNAGMTLEQMAEYWERYFAR